MDDKPNVVYYSSVIALLVVNCLNVINSFFFYPEEKHFHYQSPIAVTMEATNGTFNFHDILTYF